MTHRCKENAANNTGDENEFGDSSNVLELSDAIRHRRRLNKKYNNQMEIKNLHICIQLLAKHVPTAFKKVLVLGAR